MHSNGGVSFSGVAAPRYITPALSPAGKLQRLCDGSGCRVGRKIKAADRWTVTGFSLIIWRVCLVRGEKNTHTHTHKRKRWQPQRRVQTLCFAFEAGVFYFFPPTFFHLLTAPAHPELSAPLRTKGSGRRGHGFFSAISPSCWLPPGRQP